MAKLNYYQVLGVATTASTAEIKQAYRRLVQLHHPDKGGSATHFKRLKEAYDVLSDGDKRASYDAEHSVHATAAVAPAADFVPPGGLMAPTGYDPFYDVLYHKRRFFQPQNPRLEEFERGERARALHCPVCHGRGYLKRRMSNDPNKAFMSLEERLCGCQLLERV